MLGTDDLGGTITVAMSQCALMPRIDLRGQYLSAQSLRQCLPSHQVSVESVLDRVEPIVQDVSQRGVQAACEYSQRFDHVCPATIRVDHDDLARAAHDLDPRLTVALTEAIRRIRQVHLDQLPVGMTSALAPGATISERWVPVERVGLYVPAGNAVYPSSVVMNVVPAQVAGVGSLVIASPPQASHGGLPDPVILATAHLLGIEEVWAVGGAQGIALLAYGGTDTTGDQLSAVDMITGPGNIYVAAAKRLCRAVVGIDAEAGPTEIVILADESADPGCVAADLISQAEHDELASSVLITTSPTLADQVDQQIATQILSTSHQQRIRQALSGPQSAIILVDDLQAGICLADGYAAEHLEIHTHDAMHVAQQIHHAGAIFVGSFSPVSLGDYCAGSNHVLPTAGSARYSAGLSTYTFLRRIPVICYDRDALAQVREHIHTLAYAEDLPAHAQAIHQRFAQ